MVEETAVVQPLRGVVRLATADDLRVAEINKKREKEAFGICEKKIAQKLTLSVTHKPSRYSFHRPSEMAFM